MQEVELRGVASLIEGAVEVREAAGYLRPWRLPIVDADLHDPALRWMAGIPSGVRLRFRTDSPVVSLAVAHVFPVGLDVVVRPRYDLVVQGEVVSIVEAPSEEGVVSFEGLPSDEVVEIWLPQVTGVRLTGMLVADGAVVEAVPDLRPRWVTYGSSITHCFEADGPTGTWPSVAARALDWHLTSLGFAGQCHLDPHVARTIAALPADRITLKVGINVHNMASVRERAFAPLVHGMLATIRDAHPRTPITVISPVLSPEREDTGRTVRVLPEGIQVLDNDLSLMRMREILASVVEVWRRRGDTAIDHLDGRELFGLGDGDLDHLPDGLHPDAEGYRRIGERFARAFGA